MWQSSRALPPGVPRDRKGNTLPLIQTGLAFGSDVDVRYHTSPQHDRYVGRLKISPDGTAQLLPTTPATLPQQSRTRSRAAGSSSRNPGGVGSRRASRGEGDEQTQQTATPVADGRWPPAPQPRPTRSPLPGSRSDFALRPRTGPGGARWLRNPSRSRSRLPKSSSITFDLRPAPVSASEPARVRHVVGGDGHSDALATCSDAGGEGNGDEDGNDDEDNDEGKEASLEGTHNHLRVSSSLPQLRGMASAEESTSATFAMRGVAHALGTTRLYAAGDSQHRPSVRARGIPLLAQIEQQASAAARADLSLLGISGAWRRASSHSQLLLPQRLLAMPEVVAAAEVFDQRQRVLTRRTVRLHRELRVDVTSLRKAEALDVAMAELCRNRFVVREQAEEAAMAPPTAAEKAVSAPKKFDVTVSWWAPRAKGCDSGSLYESSETYQQMISIDWYRALHDGRLRRYIARADDGGAAGVDAELEDVVAVLWEAARLIYSIYDEYALLGANSIGDCYCVSLGAFMGMVADMQLDLPDSATCRRSDLDSLCIEVDTAARRSKLDGEFGLSRPEFIQVCLPAPALISRYFARLLHTADMRWTFSFLTSL